MSNELAKMTVFQIHGSLYEDGMDTPCRSVTRLIVCNGLDEAVRLAPQVSFGEIPLGHKLTIERVERVTDKCYVQKSAVVGTWN